jgi:hypothetical protein
LPPSRVSALPRLLKLLLLLHCCTAALLHCCCFAAAGAEALGLNNLVEAVSGYDVGTGQVLSTQERAIRGALGAFDFVTTAVPLGRGVFVGLKGAGKLGAVGARFGLPQLPALQNAATKIPKGLAGLSDDAARLSHNAARQSDELVGLAGVRSANRPLGGRGPISGRPFDAANAGGAIRNLTTDRIRITHRGIDYTERHLARFGPDAPNQLMVQRLRNIADGMLRPIQYDLNFYSHELRESVRYRRLGHPTGAGDNYALWNNAHTGSLEDYWLPDFDANGNRTLYHPDVWHLFD